MSPLIRFVPELVGEWQSPDTCSSCPECGSRNTTGVSEPSFPVARQCFSCGARYVPEPVEAINTMQSGIIPEYIDNPDPDCLGQVHCPNCRGKRTNLLMTEDDIVCQCYDCGFRCPQGIAFDRERK